MRPDRLARLERLGAVPRLELTPEELAMLARMCRILAGARQAARWTDENNPGFWVGRGASDFYPTTDWAVDIDGSAEDAHSLGRKLADAFGLTLPSDDSVGEGDGE